jgi:hypothetical protein
LKNRQVHAIDERDDAEEGEDGDPAKHGSADRLLQRADEDDQAQQSQRAEEWKGDDGEVQEMAEEPIANDRWRA